MRRLTFALLIWVGGCASDGAAADDPRLLMSRELAAQFGAELKDTLVEALQGQGPVAAMTVCRDAAPNIAARLARRTGAKIGRTSRRYRNPLNAPEPWQRNVLAELFEPTVAATDRRVEYFAREGGDVRYMQAIRLGPLCSVCHGAELSGSVRGFLSDNYPHDLARGFQPGQLRGAFSVIWPAQNHLGDGP